MQLLFLCNKNNLLNKSIRFHFLLITVSMWIRCYMTAWWMPLIYYYLNLHRCNIFFQLHTASLMWQGRQRESSAKTLHFPLSAEFWRRVEWQDSTSRLCFDTRAKKCIWDRTHSQSRLQSRFMFLRHDWLQQVGRYVST